MSAVLKYSSAQKWLAKNKSEFIKGMSIVEFEILTDNSYRSISADFADGGSESTKLEILLSELLTPELGDLAEKVYSNLYGRLQDKLDRKVDENELSDLLYSKDWLPIFNQFDKIEDDVAQIREQMKQFIDVFKPAADCDNRQLILDLQRDMSRNLDNAKILEVTNKLANVETDIKNIVSVASHSKNVGNLQQCKIVAESMNLLYQHVLETNLKLRQIFVTWGNEGIKNSYQHYQQVSSNEESSITFNNQENGNTVFKTTEFNEDISCRITLIPLYLRRLARVTKNLLNIPMADLKNFFVQDTKLVTEKEWSITEVMPYPEKGKVLIIISNHVFRNVTYDIVPALSQFLENKYPHVSKVLNDRPSYSEGYTMETLSPDAQTTLSFTFLLLNGIRSLAAKHCGNTILNQFLSAKEKFYCDWIDFSKLFVGKVKFMEVVINNTTMETDSQMSQPKSNVQLFKILIKKGEELLADAKKFHSMMPKVEKAIAEEKLRKDAVLKAITENTEDEFQYLLYILDGLNFEGLITKRAELFSKYRNTRSFELVINKSKYQTADNIIASFIENFVLPRHRVNTNLHGLTPWQRKFMKLKKKFVDTDYDNMAIMLTGNNVIDASFERCLYTRSKGFEKNDKMIVLFDKLLKKKNSKKNFAILHTLSKTALLDKDDIDDFGNAPEHDHNLPDALRFPERHIHSIYGECSLIYSTTIKSLETYVNKRINYILTWIRSTPNLAYERNKGLQARKIIKKQVEKAWKAVLKVDGIIESSYIITIESFKTKEEDFRNSLSKIKMTVKDIQAVITGKSGKNDDEPGLQTLLKKAIEALQKISQESKDRKLSDILEILTKEDKSLQEEFQVFQEIIELCEYDEIRFEAFLIRGKMCGKFEDPNEVKTMEENSLPVKGYEDKIAKMFENSLFASNKSLLPHLLSIPTSDVNMVKDEENTLVAFANCFQIWSGRNGKRATFNRLKSILTESGWNGYAEDVSKLQESLEPPPKVIK